MKFAALALPITSGKSRLSASCCPVDSSHATNTSPVPPRASRRTSRKRPPISSVAVSSRAMHELREVGPDVALWIAHAQRAQRSAGCSGELRAFVPAHQQPECVTVAFGVIGGADRHLFAPAGLQELARGFPLASQEREARAKAERCGFTKRQRPLVCQPPHVLANQRLRIGTRAGCDMLVEDQASMVHAQYADEVRAVPQ